MSKNTTIALSVLLFIAVTASSTYAVMKWSTDNRKKSVAKPSTDISLQSVAARSQNNTNPQSEPSLQVQGANTTQQSSTISSGLPTPDMFKQYEEFAQSESIRYVDEKLGTGEVAATGDEVAVVYSGWLTNGTLFDQSQKNEQGQIVAFSFKIGARQVIQGWEQGIAGMMVGGKRRLILPSQFAYGETGQGPIPPNAMLIFDVELVDLKKDPNTILP